MMMDYQKMLIKEAREDKRLAQQTRDRAARVKALLDHGQIDAQMKEAQDKADAALNAAEAQLVVSDALSMAAAAPPRVGAAASLPQDGGVSSATRVGGSVVDAGARE